LSIPELSFVGDIHRYVVYTSAFQPVRRYALVQMRKPCGADDKHGVDKCGWENPVV